MYTSLQNKLSLTSLRDFHIHVKLNNQIFLVEFTAIFLNNNGCILIILINNNNNITKILTIFPIHMTMQYLQVTVLPIFTILSLQLREEKFKGEHIFPFTIVIIYIFFNSKML